MISARKAVLVVLVCLAAATSTAWGLEVGDPIPDFVLPTFDGGTVSRASLEGRVSLVIFWNTWCPNCMRELPELARSYAKLGPEGLVVLAVNTALNDSETRARAYWEKQGYSFPAGFDRTFDVGQSFGLFGVPTVILVDPKGVVRYKQARLPDDLELQFANLTGKK